jgi:hypothetical protein
MIDENGNIELITDRIIAANLCCLCWYLENFLAEERLEDEVLSALLKGLPGLLRLQTPGLPGLNVTLEITETSRSSLDMTPDGQCYIYLEATFTASLCR